MASKSFYRAVDSSLISRSSGLCRDGVFVSTPYTIGPWNKNLQHGGPPLALCARSVEGKASDLGLPNVVHLVGRFFRPVPVAKVRVECSVLKEGSKVAHVEASLLEESTRKELLRVTAVCTREEDVTGVPPAPEGATVPNMTLPPAGEIGEHGWHYGTRIGLNPLVDSAVANLASNKKCDRGSEKEVDDSCYLKAFTFHQISGTYGKGPTAIWAKQLVSTIEGEAASPLERLVTIADSCNGLSYYTNWANFTFINSDITLQTHRKPTGSAIGLQSRTVLNPAVGTGVATGDLFDSFDGSHVGTCNQSLLLQKRS